MNKTIRTMLTVLLVILLGASSFMGCVKTDHVSEETTCTLKWVSALSETTFEPFPEVMIAVVDFFLSDTVIQATVDEAYADYYGEVIQIKMENGLAVQIKDGALIRVTVSGVIARKPVLTVRAVAVEVIS